MKRPQILVIGYGDYYCPGEAARLAYEVGREVAAKGGILVSGGLGGVMEAASRGAKEAGGLVVGVIPFKEMKYANAYCDVVIPTGMGQIRNFLTAYSGDGVIIVGGGVGTLTEACVAYQEKKPVVVIKGSGGVADEIVDIYLDYRQNVKIIGESSPKAAVEWLFSLLASTTDV